MSVTYFTAPPIKPVERLRDRGVKVDMVEYSPVNNDYELDKVVQRERGAPV